MRCLLLFVLLLFVNGKPERRDEQNSFLIAETLCYAALEDRPARGSCKVAALGQEVKLELRSRQEISLGNMGRLVMLEVARDSSLLFVVMEQESRPIFNLSLVSPYPYDSKISLYGYAYDMFESVRIKFWKAVTGGLNTNPTAKRVRITGIGKNGVLASVALVDAIVSEFEELYRMLEPSFNVSVVTFGEPAPSDSKETADLLLSHSYLRVLDPRDTFPSGLGVFSASQTRYISSLRKPQRGYIGAASYEVEE